MTFSKEIIHKKLIFSKEIIFSGQGTGHCPARSIVFFVLNANYRKLYVNLPKTWDIWILRDIKI